MEYVCNVIKSRRKTLAIEVKRPNEVIVRAPLRCSQNRIQYFLEMNQNWIAKRLAYYRDHPGLPEPTFLNGSTVWLLGKPYEVCAKSGGKRQIQLTETQLTMTKPELAPGDESNSIERWYRKWAEDYFQSRAAELYSSAPIQLPSYSCKVRKMKRQWGNCSRKGDIKLSLALIQYPPECVDYVIYHEMSHLLHFNHSAAFYSVLTELCPDWQTLKHQLETFSP